MHRFPKKILNHYKNRGNQVFATFIDFSKAFDRVNIWKLFHKLIDDGVSKSTIKLLSNWYSSQRSCIRWQGHFSEQFGMGNGTRQGAVLSPLLFNRYLRELILEVSQTKLGCCIGNLFMNILVYADDIVILTPSWLSMQKILNIVHKHAMTLDMSCNVQKTACLIFKGRDNQLLDTSLYPNLNIGGDNIKFVQKYKHLGLILNDQLNDDCDIAREMSNLYVRTNILLRRFATCNISVKLHLFQSFCLCFYGIALWSSYSVKMMARMRSAYNRCIKIFLGFRRHESVTGILLNLGLPSFSTILHNSQVRLKLASQSCPNNLVKLLLNY